MLRVVMGRCQANPVPGHREVVQTEHTCVQGLAAIESGALMKEQVSVLTYYSIEIPNQPGAGARILSALKEAKVNLTALWGYPVAGESARLDLVPSDPAALVAALKKIKIAAGPKRSSFFFFGKDHPGVLAESMELLAAAGVNVHAAQAVCSGSGKFGALIQVSPGDVKSAKKVFGLK